jgi:hypothetical protein
VNDMKHSGFHCGCGDWIIRIVGLWVYIGANSQTT